MLWFEELQLLSSILSNENLFIWTYVANKRAKVWTCIQEAPLHIQKIKQHNFTLPSQEAKQGFVVKYRLWLPLPPFGKILRIKRKIQTLKSKLLALSVAKLTDSIFSKMKTGHIWWSTGMPVSPTQKIWNWWEKPEKVHKFEPKQPKMGWK